MADNTIETRSLAEILHDAAGHIQEIVRAELLLARTEVRDEVGKVKEAGMALGGGALLGMFGLAWLTVTCDLALMLVLPAWLSALIMAVLCGIGGIILLGAGRERLKQVNPPRRTVQTVREDVQWAQQQTH
jgi:hypothetical protein